MLRCQHVINSLDGNRFREKLPLLIFKSELNTVLKFNLESWINNKFLEKLVKWVNAFEADQLYIVQPFPRNCVGH